MTIRDPRLPPRPALPRVPPGFFTSRHFWIEAGLSALSFALAGYSFGGGIYYGAMRARTTDELALAAVGTTVGVACLYVNTATFRRTWARWRSFWAAWAAFKVFYNANIDEIEAAMIEALGEIEKLEGPARAKFEGRIQLVFNRLNEKARGEG